jgi:hypothetical protein
MRDPVIAADGHTYEQEAIEAWLRSHNTSPMTNAQLSNRTVRVGRTRPGVSQKGTPETKCHSSTSSLAHAPCRALGCYCLMPSRLPGTMSCTAHVSSYPLVAVAVSDWLQLTPNHGLRSAIQEHLQRTGASSGL